MPNRFVAVQMQTQITVGDVSGSRIAIDGDLEGLASDDPCSFSSTATNRFGIDRVPAIEHRVGFYVDPTVAPCGGHFCNLPQSWCKNIR